MDGWASILLISGRLAQLRSHLAAEPMHTLPSNFLSQLAACAGGQINNDDSADDVKNVDLTKVNNHPWQYLAHRTPRHLMHHNSLACGNMCEDSAAAK